MSSKYSAGGTRLFMTKADMSAMSDMLRSLLAISFRKHGVTENEYEANMTKSAQEAGYDFAGVRTFVNNARSLLKANPLVKLSWKLFLRVMEGGLNAEVHDISITYKRKDINSPSGYQQDENGKDILFTDALSDINKVLELPDTPDDKTITLKMS